MYKHSIGLKIANSNGLSSFFLFKWLFDAVGSPYFPTTPLKNTQFTRIFSAELRVQARWAFQRWSSQGHFLGVHDSNRNQQVHETTWKNGVPQNLKICNWRIGKSWLVGGFSPPLWKIMEFVSWDDDIPNWIESHKIPWFQSPPTRWLKQTLTTINLIGI